MDQYWQSIGPELHLNSPADVSAFQQRYYNDERINDEVLELLTILRRKYRLAILSNHPVGLHEWLSDWQIGQLFEVIVCSGEVGLMKPDLRIYHLVLEHLQLEPEEAIFIDDTPGHVEAAQSIGIQGIVFTNAANLRQQLRPILGHDYLSI